MIISDLKHRARTNGDMVASEQHQFEVFRVMTTSFEHALVSSNRFEYFHPFLPDGQTC